MRDRYDSWLWSVIFLQNVDGLMREPQSYGAAESARLWLWRQQVDVARGLFQKGRAEALQALYDLWRTIADVGEQARIASETYHRFPCSREHRRKNPAGIVEWLDAQSHG